MNAPALYSAPVHEGERAAQMRLGVHARMAEVMAQGVRAYMPEQHRELFCKLPTLLVGSLDAARRPWASVLHGAPGFISAPDERHLRIQALPHAHDPWQPQPHTPLGLLGLEPATRRRNRMNGSVVALDAQGFTVQVDHSFGNCPRYIHARSPQRVERAAPSPALPLGPALHGPSLALIGAADTLYIASASREARAHAGAEGVDVSHRGGRAGFVRAQAGADGAITLTLPDYAGNQFFNTIGNLLVNPRAGLLFIDHTHGHLLQLTARASVVWDDEPTLAAYPGAQRLLRLTVEVGVWRPGALPYTWSAPQAPPQFERPAGPA